MKKKEYRSLSEFPSAKLGADNKAGMLSTAQNFPECPQPGGPAAPKHFKGRFLMSDQPNLVLVRRGGRRLSARQSGYR
jgi:hypothetical protein